MKNKELEVWIDSSFDGFSSEPQSFYEIGIYSADPNIKGIKFSKATLIMDIPEPSIEITPSRLREALLNDQYDPEKFEPVFKELFGTMNEKM